MRIIIYQQMQNKLTFAFILFIAIPPILAKLVWIADIANPGARYPINDVYDGNANVSLQGQLNSVGMRQQYLLGTYLRSDYVDQQNLIQHTYNPNTVEVFACTDLDITYDSALSRLYGLFPTGTGWRIPEEVPKERLDPPYQSNFSYRGLQDDDLPFALNLGYQPVPIWPLDAVLNDACPNAGVIKTKRLQQIAKNLTAFQAQHSALMSKAKLVFNLSVLQMHIPSMADLYDTLLSDITLGKQLPKTWDDYDMKSLKFISDYYNTLLFDGSYSQLFATLLLSTVKTKMESIRSRTLGDKKWSMFFPKQGTLTPLMTLLNLTSTDCLTQKWKNQTITALNCMQPPTFSSNLIMELHQDDSFEYAIRIKYNGQYAAMCEKATTKCEYRNFWNRLNLNSTDYKAACYNK